MKTGKRGKSRESLWTMTSVPQSTIQYTPTVSKEALFNGDHPSEPVSHRLHSSIRRKPVPKHNRPSSYSYNGASRSEQTFKVSGASDAPGDTLFSDQIRSEVSHDPQAKFRSFQSSVSYYLPEQRSKTPLCHHVNSREHHEFEDMVGSSDTMERAHNEAMIASTNDALREAAAGLVQTGIGHDSRSCLTESSQWSQRSSDTPGYHQGASSLTFDEQNSPIRRPVPSQHRQRGWNAFVQNLQSNSFDSYQIFPEDGNQSTLNNEQLSVSRPRITTTRESLYLQTTSSPPPPYEDTRADGPAEAVEWLERLQIIDSGHPLTPAVSDVSSYSSQVSQPTFALPEQQVYSPQHITFNSFIEQTSPRSFTSNDLNGHSTESIIQISTLHRELIELYDSGDQQMLEPYLLEPSDQNESYWEQQTTYVAPPIINMVCSVCSETIAESEIPVRPPTELCDHDVLTCGTCLGSWIESQLDEKAWDQVKCPDCQAKLQYGDVQSFAEPDVFKKYEARSAKACLTSIPGFQYCFSPTCDSGQIHEGGENEPIFRCSACGFRGCIKHGRKWHDGETCEQYDRRKGGYKEEELASTKFLKDKTKICPGKGCGYNVEKISGCDHMTCTKCNWEFCWLCLADYKKASMDNSLHARSCKYHTANLV